MVTLPPMEWQTSTDDRQWPVYTIQAPASSGQAQTDTGRIVLRGNKIHGIFYWHVEIQVHEPRHETLVRNFVISLSRETMLAPDRKDRYDSQLRSAQTWAIEQLPAIISKSTDSGESFHDLLAFM